MSPTIKNGKFKNLLKKEIFSGVCNKTGNRKNFFLKRNGNVLFSRNMFNFPELILKTL
jgi:hypothetical protein